jgi:hypothetical protein
LGSGHAFAATTEIRVSSGVVFPEVRESSSWNC